MGIVKCFDVVKMVTDVATEQFSPGWKVDEEKYSILKEYCQAIDILSEEFNGESFEVEVDEIKMNIRISLICDEIEIENSQHLFYQLLERAENFQVKQVNGNNCIEFTFPSVWDKD